MYLRKHSDHEIDAILAASWRLAELSVETGKLIHLRHPKWGELLMLERVGDGKDKTLLFKDVGE